jgi:TetR/AcrR family transcriptional regulator, transcriptional repressor for nem operon
MAAPTDQKPQRAALMQTGEKIFQARGYTATGVREIASAAGLPQGSFTNHFRSKERFGAEVLDQYAARIHAIMDETLGNTALGPAERIFSYFDRIEGSFQDREWQIGCLIPDMAAEAPAHSEILRQRLVDIMSRSTDYFAAVLSELFPPERAEDLAGAILAAWHGTVLRMKVERTGEPIARFRRFLRTILTDDAVSSR